MSAKRLTEVQLKEMNNFNSAIRGLCRLTVFMDKGNTSLDGVRRVVTLALDTNPVDPIIRAGPYLKKYAEQVKNRDENFFLNGGINEDLKKGSAKVSGVFDIITKNWPKLEQKDKDEYWTRVDILISSSAIYESENNK